MSPWQLARQLRAILQSKAWGPTNDGSTPYTVFQRGSVIITAFPPKSAMAEAPPPSCTIRVMGSTADRQQPSLVRIRLAVGLVAMVGGDRYGSGSLTGGIRTGGQGSSSGRGIDELESVVMDAVSLLGDQSGVRLVLRRDSDADPIVDQETYVSASKQYVIEGWGVQDPYYMPLNTLTAMAIGGGNVVLSWTNPSARYDWRRPVICWQAGSSAPASPTSGTDASPTGPFPTQTSTWTVATGAGTRSFATFAAFDETGSGTDERFSNQELGTTLAGVVIT